MRLKQKKQKSNLFAVKKIFAACLICAVFSVSVFAKSLSEYRNDVNSARDLTLQLLYPDDEVTSSPTVYQNFEKENLVEIRELVPPSEKVEWKNSSIETNNQWLHEKLDAFEKEPKDSENRAYILNEIQERLTAIGKKTEELENPPVSARTKDEDKQKLSEILKREEYKKADEKDKSLFQRALEAISNWLDELFPRPNIPQTSPSTGFGQFGFLLMMFLFTLIAVAIGYVIYKFAPMFARKYRTRDKKEKKERVILGETLSDDQNSSDLFSEAEKLAREGNLRGAIRKGYIAVLCELSDRKVIGLSRHKTNRDYLRDVRGKNELYQNMNGLTLNFERHWYGFDSADEQDWEEFKNGYKKVVSNKV